MEETQFPEDFRDFLRLLEENEVEYLLIGGYAVGFHGYPRATLDMDIWVRMTPENADKMVDVMASFGFDAEQLSPEIFLDARCLVRMGVPPLRLELLTTIDGVEFETCYRRCVDRIVDGVRVTVIGLEDLRRNKKASGRHKDLADLEYLPAAE